MHENLPSIYRLVRFLVILILSNIPLSRQMSFNYSVRSRSMRCLGEFFHENSSSVFHFNSNSSEMRVRLFDINGNTIYNKENSSNVKIAFTASETGTHQICVDNYSNSDINISFMYLRGVAAKDYSELAKKSNLKPIEMHLTKLKESIEDLKHENREIMSREEIRIKASNEKISGRVIFFSFVLLLFMATIGVVEFFVIKKYLQDKKVI